MLDNPNRYYRDVIRERTLSKFPKRIPRFSLQSRDDNELATSRNGSLLVRNIFSRHVVLLIGYVIDSYRDRRNRPVNHGFLSELVGSRAKNIYESYFQEKNQSTRGSLCVINGPVRFIEFHLATV